MNFEIGSRIFDYEVVGVLGAGGMGKVFKVRNVISDRIDAMKVLLPSLTDQPELADRFLREIKVLASLSHPNIAAFHTALRFENRLIMVMEFVQGITLNERLSQGPVPLDESLSYMRQALSALGYAHGQGVIHRDIKPANIMLTPERAIKLMDFGIAKAASDPQLTRTGTTLGSLHYISPEALSGTGLDARSDLYSLGVTMYEVVTGKRPFEGKSEYSLMAAHLKEAPRPPVEIEPGIPAPVSAAILKALEKDPAKRFQTADEFRAALERAPVQIGAPEEAEEIPPVTIPMAPRAPVTPRRSRYVLLGAVAAIIVIVAAAVELPRWLRARAPAGVVSSPTQSAPVSAAPHGSVPAATLPPAVQQQPPALSQESGSGSEKTPLAAERAAAASVKRPVRQLHGRTSASHPAGEPVPAASQSASQPASVPGAAPPQSPPAVQPSAQDAAAFEGLEDRMSQLAGRANAAKTTIANLQQQEVSSGLSLRPDVLASENRMERYMDQADSALSAHNLPLAKHNMDLAEREIRNLEGFFGR